MYNLVYFAICVCAFAFDVCYMSDLLKIVVNIVDAHHLENS